MLRFEKLFLQGFKSFCDPTEIAFDDVGITAVVGPNGCGKCVDGDTLVTLEDGRDVAIRELVEAALREADLIEELDDGLLTRENPRNVEILTLDPATLCLEPRPVFAFVKRTTTPYLLRIRTQTGREVEATPYHPLFTLENGRIRALKAEELQVGVRVAVPRSLPIPFGFRHSVESPVYQAAQNLSSFDLLPRRQQKKSSGIPLSDAGIGRDIITSDVHWDEIVSIEQVEPKDEWVYDLSVAGTHNFVAGNIIVHNSNVADAISWVIGEQRAKALRGSKMDDVIFQGSRNRQPAGMAEVVLTMIVQETFEVRGEAQPEAEALKHAEESLTQAEAAVEAIDEAVAAEEAAVEGDQTVEVESGQPESAQQLDGQKTAQQTKKPKHRRLHTKDSARVFQAGERVTVARRLYRTGESEYEMNGRICRLRDVQDLFAGTGLGGAHYAIIEQGRIGQVLSAKPLDRRALIEEAAGISKFKMRQHAAELKLEASKQNLARITDIISEIERQQNSLKRQAARARRYKRLRQEMRDLMRSVYVVDYRATSRAIAELEAALDEVTGRELQMAASIATREAGQDEATRTARAADEALNEMREIVTGLDLETERARQQQSYLAEQIQSLGERSAQFSKDQATIAERSQFIAQEITRLREELHGIEQEINTESRVLSEEESRHREKMQSDAEAEHKLEDARKTVYESVTNLERWRQLKRQYEDAVDRSKSRLRGLAAESERAQTQATTAIEQHAKVAVDLEATSIRQQEIVNSLAEISSKLVELRQLRDERQTKLAALQRDLTVAEQRLKSLAQIEERRAYFSEAVQVLMKHSSQSGMEQYSSQSDGQSNNFSALGTLADFVKVAPEHEAMIEAALRDELQYVVVPSFDDALRAIEFLKSEGAGRATFLVLEQMTAENSVDHTLYQGNGSSSHTDHDHTNPSHSVETQSQFRYQTLGFMLGLQSDLAEAFELALPGLANACVVEDVAQAIITSRSGNGSWSMVSLARTGERAIGGRLVMGGSVSEKGIGVLALKREIGELHERIELLIGEARGTEAELIEIKSEVVEMEETHSRLDGEQRQIEKRLVVLREQLQQCQRERERTATHIRVVEQEMTQAAEELKEFETKLLHAAQQTEEADKTREEAEAVVAAAQAEIAELRRSTQAQAQELSRRRADFAARTERRRSLQNDIRRLENEAADLENRLSRNRFEAIEADEHISSMRETIISVTEQLQQLTALRRLKTTDLEQRSARLAAAREKVESLEMELRAAREAASAAREERALKEIEKARLSSDLQHLIQSCQTELNENIVEVCERLERSNRGDDSVSLPNSPSQPVDEQTSSEEATLTTELQQPQAHGPLSDAGISGDVDDEEADREIEISFWTVPDDFDLNAAKARLDELRSKIDALGPVNMMALEELGEVEERFDFLVSQKDDIEKAIADTQSAIAEIKRRSREKFVEAFHAINENFKHMFVELFGGGHGEMRLIDETDVLESGIEIIAQPPGKRLQNVLLLSGGEKAMAALSLVMAIFKYRPSPFCLLDEVDAPLDDVNIGRFSDKIIEMSAGTQFMIITHSKRTMEAARTLYGVTMEDPGVSKLVSVRLS